MTQSYQLGYDIYLPIAQIQYFDHEVQDLTNSTSDAETNTKLATLDKLAARTRLIEQLSITQAADLMLKMGVPKKQREPYQQAAAALTKPLAIAEDAKKDKKLDPASARILSTMEEADQLIPHDVSVLITWLKVAKGSDADWSFHVGTLEASLAVASDNNAPAVALLDTLPALVAKTPAAAPGGAKDAMLALGHDIEKKQDITQPMLADAARALHKAFEGD